MHPLRVIYLASIAVPLVVRMLVGAPGDVGVAASRELYRSLLGHADPLVLFVLLAIALVFATIEGALEQRAVENLDTSATTVVLMALSGAATVIALGLASWLSMKQISGSHYVAAHRQSSGMSRVTQLAMLLGIADTLLAIFRVRSEVFRKRMRDAVALDEPPTSTPSLDDAQAAPK